MEIPSGPAPVQQYNSGTGGRTRFHRWGRPWENSCSEDYIAGCDMEYMNQTGRQGLRVVLKSITLASFCRETPILVTRIA